MSLIEMFITANDSAAIAQCQIKAEADYDLAVVAEDVALTGFYAKEDAVDQIVKDGGDRRAVIAAIKERQKAELAVVNAQFDVADAISESEGCDPRRSGDRRATRAQSRG